jgi:hypothetical protein
VSKVPELLLERGTFACVQSIFTLTSEWLMAYGIHFGAKYG